MDDPSCVALAFRRLPSSTARAAALDALINELNHTEWRQLLAKLGSETFCVDIVGSLPVEIVIQIFGYLEISTPFQLQRVSRRWQTVLSSPDVLRGLLCLQGFNIALPTGLPLLGESPDVSHDYLHCRKTAEVVHRFQTGAFAKSLIVGLPPGVDCSVTYSSFEDNIAWPAYDNCAVTVLNLPSGKSLSLTGEAREKIALVALSDQLVAFFTFTGIWYACDLVTGQRKSFRLPSARVPVFSCRGKTIAGVLRDEKCPGKHVAYVWDFDRQKCRTFDLRKPDRKDLKAKPTGETFTLNPPSAVLVDPTSESLLICSKLASESDSLCSDALLYHRYSYSGDLIRSGKVNYIEKSSDAVYFKPIDRRGRFQLYFRQRAIEEGRFYPRVYCLPYDESRDYFGNGTVGLGMCERNTWWLGAHYRLSLTSTGPEPVLGCVLNRYVSQPLYCTSELNSQ
ncbi:uncharacterized protein BDZ99DRAFT_410387 [Mytilinidion resinicola]|uniref:F-box domain-containing protein n=1 Tax=Mytilinidion resinicola TaxID=574789 RepID=A0A6A6Z046_9PEZI|nr:uncharacterized protein BDZ99DRAFT_410387 [Mytilinidion resinicola]KAF2814073.1 hypothetical protein BDZ99DRAFT_410387 [Mytilinidion resinicola]